jgi:IstB-like ATP binding protein
VFGDAINATAILDRLLHDSTTLNISGENSGSRRSKAGLLGRTLLTTVTPPQDESSCGKSCGTIGYS